MRFIPYSASGSLSATYELSAHVSRGPQDRRRSISMLVDLHPLQQVSASLLRQSLSQSPPPALGALAHLASLNISPGSTA